MKLSVFGQRHWNKFEAGPKATATFKMIVGDHFQGKPVKIQDLIEFGRPGSLQTYLFTPKTLGFG